MLWQDLIHLEHVDGINTEKGTQWFITVYISPIFGVLQIFLSNVGPQLLDNLEPRLQTNNFTIMMIPELAD